MAFWQFLRSGFKVHRFITIAISILIVELFELLVDFGGFDLPAVLVDLGDEFEAVVGHHSTESFISFDFVDVFRHFQESRIIRNSFKSLILYELCWPRPLLSLLSLINLGCCFCFG